MNTRRFATRAGLTGAAALFAAAGFAGQAFASQAVPAADVAAPVVDSVASPDLANGTFTATVPGCTSHGAWRAHSGVGGYSEAKWTSNPCGFKVEDRSWCENSAGTDGHWSTSGVVIRVGNWDKAACSAPDSIRRGELRVGNGDSWSPYRSYWTP